MSDVKAKEDVSLIKIKEVEPTRFTQAKRFRTKPPAAMLHSTERTYCESKCVDRTGEGEKAVGGGGGFNASKRHDSDSIASISTQKHIKIKT